jgi:hypothetical protein
LSICVFLTLINLMDMFFFHWLFFNDLVFFEFYFSLLIPFSSIFLYRRPSCLPCWSNVQKSLKAIHLIFLDNFHLKIILFLDVISLLRYGTKGAEIALVYILMTPLSILEILQFLYWVLDSILKFSIEDKRLLIDSRLLSRLV